MTDLPEPLTPAGCDLRGYEFMPLHGQRLFGSSLYTKSLRNPRAGLAAIKLWWSAWQQCPAGSLPDEDDDLAMLADFGVDLKGWKAVREIALHGFVKCSDGRLYHPLLCSAALVAFEKRRKERVRKAKLRAKNDAESDGTDDSGGKGPDAAVPQDVPELSRGTDAGQDADVRDERTGQDRTLLRKEEPKPAALAPSAPKSAKDILWQDGLDIMVHLTGKSPNGLRGLMGKWLSDLQDDCPRLMLLIQQAQEAKPGGPVAWIAKSVSGINAQRSRPVQSRFPGGGYAIEAQAALVRAEADNPTLRTIDGSFLDDDLPLLPSPGGYHAH